MVGKMVDGVLVKKPEWLELDGKIVGNPPDSLAVSLLDMVPVVFAHPPDYDPVLQELVEVPVMGDGQINVHYEARDRPVVIDRLASLEAAMDALLGEEEATV